jgi:hypothetical protein
MQTRPFFKNLLSKVSKAFFPRPDRITPPPSPDFKPEVKQKKSSGGRGFRHSTRYSFRRRKVTIDAPSKDPRFMSRAARVRAGFQRDAPTWWRALRNARVVGMSPNQYWNYFEPRKVATLQP